jgi:UDP-glucose:(heptosyl)LPS alpha-1,3-glucosyltransferase
MRKPRLAVISPFIDKRHGTERRVAEWISRLGEDFEIHVYSQRVEDVDLEKITVHRIPKIPGPHLANFLWWFGANHLWRWWDRRFRGLNPDLVYTPGTNCLDADAVSVHIVFAEFYRQVEPELRFRSNSIWFWPRLLHRRLYYRLVMFLERKIYSNPRVSLIPIARKTAADLQRLYGRNDNLPVVYLGLDHAKFNPEVRRRLRSEVRKQLGVGDGRFVLLLIGNDWRLKGLPALLDALQKLRDLPVCLLVAGKDDLLPYKKRLRESGLEERVRFLPSRPDVESYYAAADAYVGPSLEDAFAQPAAEAMACGLPVIISITMGASEIMHDGVDGLILRDPTDAEDLAAKIRLLWTDAALRSRLGAQATQTAQQYTWDRNGKEMRAILQEVLRSKAADER